MWELWGNQKKPEKQGCSSPSAHPRAEGLAQSWDPPEPWLGRKWSRKAGFFLRRLLSMPWGSAGRQR